MTDYFGQYVETMCEDCKDRFKLNPLRILDCKVEADQELVKDAPKIEDYLSEEDKQEFASILNILKELNIPYQVSDRSRMPLTQS